MAVFGHACGRVLVSSLNTSVSLYKVHNLGSFHGMYPFNHYSVLFITKNFTACTVHTWQHTLSNVHGLLRRDTH